MKLIIDIPEETYDYWKEHKHEYVLSEAIANGIPLPKRHGRLVDVDKLCGHCGIREYNCCGDCDKCEYYVVKVSDIREAKTIVEADKEDVNEIDN